MGDRDANRRSTDESLPVEPQIFVDCRRDHPQPPVVGNFTGHRIEHESDGQRMLRVGERRRRLSSAVAESPG